MLFITLTTYSERKKYSHSGDFY